jgi:hypothetical protein
MQISIRTMFSKAVWRGVEKDRHILYLVMIKQRHIRSHMYW